MRVENLPELFEEAAPILKALQDNGFEAYFVGGSVRDLLINRPINDIDIATSAYPEEIKQTFKKTVDTGIEHGTVTVIENKQTYEVTTFRTESDYQDFRRPDKVTFVKSLTEDLKRRDFTINALAMDANGEIVDLFGGLDDLNHKVIKAVGNPSERFHEDALRMMRAVRFQSQLDFEIEQHTKEAIIEHHELLSKIAVERVRDEFLKLGLGQGFKKGFKSFIEFNLLKQVPILYDYESELRRLLGIDFLPANEVIFWSMIAVSCQLPLDKIRPFLVKWKNSNKIKEEVVAVVELFDVMMIKEPTNRELYQYGLTTLLQTIELMRMFGEEVNATLLVDRYNQLLIKSRDELAIDGKILIKDLGFRPGPAIGQILYDVEEAILNHELENNLKAIKNYIEVGDFHE
ncbi:CCA tRNA nucleotidyltransferase [Holzapfeliella sp. He02]|uniref:CCA-adding enzyme n=1 Tax=Holzapfeliella saturejae TaxID=3082953 RepID=A0ABU8SG93_9LACO